MLYQFFTRISVAGRKPLNARLSALAVAAALIPVSLAAEKVPAAEADTLLTLKEVSVTAIKGGSFANHDEAVTSLGEKSLRRLDVVNLKQASEIAPNFYIPAYGSRMTSTVYVRGLGARIDQPAVGLNIDNVPILNKDNFDFDLTDIARLEILRGPQNILYGRNTMGGLVNIYTLSPLAWQGVRLRATYGNPNAYKASAAIYGRLVPGLGMGLNLLATGTDGFYRNEYNNTPVGRERNWSARWKTAWRPAENVLVENAATLSIARQNGYPYQSVATGKIAYNDTCYYRRTSFTDGLTVKHRFRGIDFSSIISFQYIDDDMTLDQDFLPVDYFTLTQARKEWGITADFVARGGKGRYRWLGGVFGFGKRATMNAPVTFGDFGIASLIEHNRNEINPGFPVRWDERSFLLGSDFTLPSGGASAYHESSLSVGDWVLTLGLRFDWEHAAISYRSHCNSSYTIYRGDPADGVVYRTDPVRIDNRGKLSKDFCQLLPKLSVSYTLPDNAGNIYASATKGYKAGGYNTQMFSEVLQQNVMEIMGLNSSLDLEKTISYDPEKNWTFEAGTHLNLLDGRLRADYAFFWIECADQQLTIFPDGTTTGRMMANAGRSRSQGIELSATYAPTENWEFRASYGYTDARFRDFDNGRADYSGNTVPYAPSNTMFLGAVWTRDFKGIPLSSLTLQANARGVGKIWWDEANTVSQPFYCTLAASVTARFGNFSAELWADNITATQYDTFYFVSIGNAFLQRGPRASFGLTARWNLEF